MSNLKVLYTLPSIKNEMLVQRGTHFFYAELISNPRKGIDNNNISHAYMKLIEQDTQYLFGYSRHVYKLTDLSTSPSEIVYGPWHK